MRGLALIVVAVLLPLALVGREPPNPEVIWNSASPEHASTSRWVCSSLGGDVIEFRFYPKLKNGFYQWIIRQGQTFTFAESVEDGLVVMFALQHSSHEIHIGADRVARYFAFSGKEGEVVQSSAVWVGCKQT
jgi:hypothetical protein